MEILLVGVGGAAGSVVRYILGRMITKSTRSTFPWGTMIINITGALLLGIVTGLKVSHGLALLLADGFLGAYTTFSTFMYEGFHLFKDSKWLNAIVYVAGSLAMGVAFFVGGYGLAGIVFSTA